MKITKWMGLALVFLGFVSMISGCAGKRGESLTIKGSDTMVILGQRWAEEYMKSHKGVVIQVTGGGSGTGISALINGGTDICQASRPMKAQERELAQSKHGKAITEISVALDGIAVYVHEKNPIGDLTLDHLKDIYTGKLISWKDLDGADKKIVAYGRENNSGTYVYFKEHVLKDEDFASDIQTLPGTAAVVNAVAHDIQGIGYGGIGYAKGVKELTVNGVAPTMQNVTRNRYPISRSLYFYTVGEPAGLAKEFITWVLSDDGQKICQEVGYYPLR